MALISLNMRVSADLKYCASCMEEKPIGKFHNRKASIDGLSPRCKQCKKEADNAYNKKNALMISEKKKRYRNANKEKIAADMAARYRADKDGYKARASKWVRNNPDKRKVVSRRYQIRNPDKVNALSAKYREKRVLLWGQEDVKNIYKLASWLNHATRGFTDKGRCQKWHVDHIIPLRGKLVSGLHVANNLRVIPAIDNIVKGNKVPCL